MDKNRLLQGNDACALGALKAGVKFCGGYPITPSSDIMELLAVKLPEYGGRFIQMEDEIASMGAIIGASVMGCKAITATSGPGFDLMQENLAYAAMAEIPCVVVDVQRSGPSTGGATNPGQGDLMQAKYGRSGDCPMIALYPNSVKEIYKMTIQAFNYSEKYMTPVVLLTDETIGHLRESLNIDEYESMEIINREMPTIPPEEYHPYAVDESGIVKLAPFGNGKGYRYAINGMHHTVDGMPNVNKTNTQQTIARINDKIDKHQKDIWLWEEREIEGADTLIVACGAVSRSAAEAIRIAGEAGQRVGLFRPITIWPFPAAPFKKALDGIKTVVVPEMNRGQLIHIIKEYVPDDVKIIPLHHYDGTVIMPQQIVKVLEEAVK